MDVHMKTLYQWDKKNKLEPEEEFAFLVPQIMNAFVAKMN